MQDREVKKNNFASIKFFLKNEFFFKQEIIINFTKDL
jgi:hypothetical protein